MLLLLHLFCSSISIHINACECNDVIHRLLCCCHLGQYLPLHVMPCWIRFHIWNCLWCHVMSMYIYTISLPYIRWDEPFNSTTSWLQENKFLRSYIICNIEMSINSSEDTKELLFQSCKSGSLRYYSRGGAGGR